jgi:catalase
MYANEQYHWRPNFEPKQFDFDETLRTQGLDPDYSKRQLFELISKGGTMGWTLNIQVMTPEEATKTSFDPFDVTKIWPRGTSAVIYTCSYANDLRRIPNAGSRRLGAKQKPGGLSS